jgi:predicted MFS family arabinose efflux permease
MPTTVSDESAALHLPRRWGVLAAYVVVVGLSQLLWLNFAPLGLLVQTRYHVSELTASLLVLVFPLLYVLLSVHAGAMTDRRGYRHTVGLGAVVMAVGACVRIDDASFWALLAGQVIIAVAQPYVVNGISKLVTDWFSEEQGAIATGLGTMGMFIGMAVGMAATPPLVGAAGLRGTMVIFAVVSIAAAALFYAVVRENEARPAATAADGAAPADFGGLLRDRRILVLLVLAFLGLGVFNGLTTWLEQILAPFGIDAENAGLVGGVIIVGGIVGAVVVPLLSDLARRRKPFLVACVIAALATTYPLCSSGQLTTVLVLGGVYGFFFLPAFALLLEMCAQVAGARAAGAATSLLMLAGNAGGVVVILAMDAVKSGKDFHPSVLLLVGLLALTLALALLAPETSRR